MHHSKLLVYIIYQYALRIYIFMQDLHDCNEYVSNNKTYNFAWIIVIVIELKQVSYKRNFRGALQY